MPKVSINISATDDASAILRKVSESLKDVDGSAQKSSASMITSAVSFGAASAAAIKLGQASLLAAGNMEQNEIAFKTMLGSAGKATDLLKDMTDFAQKTPFELPGVVNAGKQMLAFGFQSNEIISNLRMLGDVSAALSQPIGDITYLFGQIKTQGRAMTQDLMQFANRGIPIYDELSKVTGKNAAQIKDMASKGQIGFKEIEAAFKNMTGEGSKFGGLMEAQSASMLGMWSNFNDALGKSQVLMGKDLMPTAKALLTTLNMIMAYDAEQVEKIQAQKQAEIERLKIRGELTTAYVEENGLIATGLNLLNGTAQSNLRLEALQKQKNDLLTIQKAHQSGANVLTEEQVGILQRSLAEMNRMEQSLKGQGQLFKTMMAPIDKINEAWEKQKKASEEKKVIEEKASREQKEALKWYDELVKKSRLAQATDEERITITAEFESKELEKRKAYLSGHYAEIKAIQDKNAETEKEKLKVQQTSKMFSDIASVQTKFYTDSSNEAANAWGKMSQTMVSSWQDASKDVSKVFDDIAKDSLKNGISMGDGFKIGASVAVAALSSINALLSMQSQLAQQNYQNQIDALESQKERELELLNEKYEAEDEIKEEVNTVDEEKQLAALAEYEKNLGSKKDADTELAINQKRIKIQAAIDEKNIAAKKAADEKAAEKAKAAEQKATEQKYALEEWKIKVEAFKAKQKADKTAAEMATAIGVIQAWSSSMSLGPIAGPIAASILTGLMVGTAAKQVSVIDSQKPPAPPQFYAGVSNFEGGWAIVGEQGPELARLPRGTDIISNDNSARAFGGPQYLVNNIYVNGVLTQQELIDLRKAASYGGY